MFLNPKEFVNGIGYFKQGNQVADFGCGSGYFALEIAKKIGDEGTVYAIDILEEPLSSIRRVAEFERIFNIKTIRSDLEKPLGSTLNNNSQDIVFIGNILHQVKNKNSLISEALRILKNKGYIIVLEYREDFPIGPSKELRIKKEDIEKLFSSFELKYIESKNVNQSHYYLVYQKAQNLKQKIKS